MSVNGGKGISPFSTPLPGVEDPVGETAAEAFPGIFAVKRADILAQSDYLRQEKLANLELWQQLYEKIRARNQCVSLRDLAGKGSDLIEMGRKPGRELGRTLQKLLELVLEDPECNTRERLLEEARRL